MRAETGSATFHRQDLPRKPQRGAFVKLPLCGRQNHGPACPICGVLEDEQEKALAKGQCGALSRPPFVLVCDRESGHSGQHRGYYSPADDVLFWGTHG